MTTINRGLSVTEPTPNLTLELRLPVDVAEPPLGYDDYGGTLAVEIALAGGGYANLILPVDGARSWAGELFSAISVAYREATGDPHALTDYELASLPPSDGYDPGPGLLVQGHDDTPARVRFHLLVDIAGVCLSTADLRAALVEHVAGRFNVAHVGVSAGEPLAGRVS